MNDKAAHDRRQRRHLVGLAALFFAPLAVSFYLYYAGDWRPGHRVNHGDLINPARPLPELALPLARARETDTSPDALHAVSGSNETVHTDAVRTDAGNTDAGHTDAGRTDGTFLRKKWTLLYWGAGSCPARCRTDLYNMRQVRLALNRDMDRVQRVFVAQGPCCAWEYLDREHPDLITVEASREATPLFALLPSYGGIDPAVADRIYLIDPLGNLMMSYAPDAKPKGMLEDLKRLLGLSSVG